MARWFSRDLGRSGIAVSVVVALVLAGCGSVFAPAAKAPAEVTIDSADLTLKGADALTAGWTRFTLTNSGAQPQVMQLARLKDGTTMPAFEAAVKQGYEQALALVTPLGGPAAGPGSTVAVLVDLQPGQHVLVGGKGIVRPFTVAAASGTTASAPKADGTITLRDFSFDMPANMSSGKQTYSVPNAGQQPHEVVIGRLAAGKTIADLTAYASKPPSGPPPLDMVGGVVGIAAAGSALLTVDLAPGQYFALCFFPDPASRKSHLALGMVKEFTVK